MSKKTSYKFISSFNYVGKYLKDNEWKMNHKNVRIVIEFKDQTSENLKFFALKASMVHL